MLETRIAKELAYISQAGLARRITELYFVNPAQAQDRTGKTYLVLASNNYLGFTHAPEVIEAASRAALKFGTGSSGSRLTTGGTFIASELEKRLADFKHSESALVFNTGYMTNLGILYGLLQTGDVVSVMNLITQVLLTAAVLAVAKWLFINIMIWQIYSGF